MLLGSAAPDGAIASEGAVAIPSIISVVASGGLGGRVLRVVAALVKLLMATA